VLHIGLIVEICLIDWKIIKIDPIFLKPSNASEVWLKKSDFQSIVRILIKIIHFSCFYLKALKQNEKFAP